MFSCGVYSTLSISVVGCLGTDDIFTSPNYPENYPVNTETCWNTECSDQDLVRTYAYKYIYSVNFFN